jgi:hypothetical protein
MLFDDSIQFHRIAALRAKIAQIDLISALPILKTRVGPKSAGSSSVIPPTHRRRHKKGVALWGLMSMYFFVDETIEVDHLSVRTLNPVHEQ